MPELEIPAIEHEPVRGLLHHIDNPGRHPLVWSDDGQDIVKSRIE